MLPCFVLMGCKQNGKAGKVWTPTMPWSRDKTLPDRLKSKQGGVGFLIRSCGPYRELMESCCAEELNLRSIIERMIQNKAEFIEWYLLKRAFGFLSLKAPDQDTYIFQVNTAIVRHIFLAKGHQCRRTCWIGRIGPICRLYQKDKDGQLRFWPGQAINCRT